jgi:outer membrane biogenesis lipoprotein LolB
MLREHVPIEGKERLDQWLAALDVHGVQYLILDTKRDSELLGLVQSNLQWTIDFQEGNSMLFTRTQAHISARVATWQEKVRHERIQADV